MEPLDLTYNAKASRNYLFSAIAASLFFVGLALWNPVTMGFVLGAFFAGVFFASRTFRWMVFPGILIFNQFLIRSAGVPYLMGGVAVQPIDWTAIFLIATVLLKPIAGGGGLRLRTGLERPIWIFLGAVAFSLFSAANLKAGVINWGHTALYFFTFYAMAADWREVPLERLWRAYFFWSVLAALTAVWQFFASGGDRSLGLAGIPLNHLVIPVLCFELARLSLGERPGRWWGWVVPLFVVTAIATQTRGLWLSGGVLLLVWLFSGYFLRPLKSWVAGQQRTRIVGVLLLLFLMFLVLLPFLGRAEQRATQLVDETGTVYLRLFLWGNAWRIFVLHPVVGIGAGQFVYAVEQFPEMKNLAVFEWTHGLSAHNLLLTFLAETGLLGTLGFLFLLAATVRFAQRGVQGARTRGELRWGWAFFLLFAVFAVSFLFAGSWDYTFAYFLALMVIFVRALPLSHEKANAG